jgi:hypothetical protein
LACAAGAIAAAGAVFAVVAVVAVVAVDAAVGLLVAFALEPMGGVGVRAAGLAAALAVCSVFMGSLFAPVFASAVLLEA